MSFQGFFSYGSRKGGLLNAFIHTCMLDPPTYFLSKFVNVNDFVIIMLCTAACDNTI